MPDLAIIVPTRDRPERFGELLAAIDRTAVGDVEVWTGVDDDDDWLSYSIVSQVTRSVVRTRNVLGPRKSLSAWTNYLAEMALEAPDPPRYLASLGDDHRPRTPAWDRSLIEAIEGRGGSGFAYGNDLFQGEGLATAWVVSADIVRAVGWMMLPACRHMYVDRAAMDLGRALDAITYCPGVVIEHEHPFVGKAAWDASYRESNAADRYAEDEAAYTAWKTSGLAADVGRVQAARLLREVST